MKLKDLRKRYRFLKKLLPELGDLTVRCISDPEYDLSRVRLSPDTVKEYNLDIYYRYLSLKNPKYQGLSPLEVYMKAYPTGKPDISPFKIAKELDMTAYLSQFKKRTGAVKVNIRQLSAEDLCRMYFSVHNWYVPSYQECIQISKSLGLKTQRLSARAMLTNICKHLGRKVTPEDVPASRPELSYRQLRAYCRKIRRKTGIQISLVNKYDVLLEYYNQNHDKIN